MQGKHILFGLKCIKFYCILVCIINLLACLRTDSYIGNSINALSIIMILVYAYGLLNVYGYFKQNTQMILVAVIRVAQFLYFHYVHGGVNLITFAVLIGLDIIWIFIQLWHKSKYEYVREQAK